MTEIRHTAPQGTSSMPQPSKTDPRMPRLADVEAFGEFMSRGWGLPDRTPSLLAGAPDAAAAHRRRLSEALPGRRLLVGAGMASVRNNDAYHDFRPHSDFAWLTGTSIEGAVVLMDPHPGGHDEILYIPEPAYPGDTRFFSDAAHGELWVGAAPGLEEWSQALAMEVRSQTELRQRLDVEGTSETLVGGYPDGPWTENGRLTVDQELQRALSTLRLIKDDWEITQLRDAVRHTVDGFAAVVGEIPTAVAGLGERWLQGTFDRYARTWGNGAGYTTIIGSGKHAPTLHWVDCDGPVLAEELILMDMGVETKSLYTADVTRTFPASGRFSAEQRKVHDLVEQAHRAAMGAVAPGRPFVDFHTTAMEVIAEGLDGWGLLTVSVDEALSAQGQQHRRYLACGVGHHLGLDVHDCARTAYEDYQGANLEAGMVLTVEPGLYFHAHDLTVPPELRGIGVRIEDDLLVTGGGAEVLSSELPIDADGIENWMARWL